jgi:hypothetical protein
MTRPIRYPTENSKSAVSKVVKVILFSCEEQQIPMGEEMRLSSSKPVLP